MVDVQSPALEPFQVDQVAYVLLFLLVVDLVPTVEALHQLFLQFLLSENIEQFSELAEIDDLFCLSQPVVQSESFLTHEFDIHLACLLYFSFLVDLYVLFIRIQHELEIVVVEPHLQGVIEHHENYECQCLFCSEVEDGDRREEVAPIDGSTILKIEDLIQAIQLLLRILLQFDEELFKGLERQKRFFGVIGMLSGSSIKDLLKFVDLDSLPEILQLRYFDLLDMVSFIMMSLLYFWLGVVERHQFPIFQMQKQIITRNRKQKKRDGQKWKGQEQLWQVITGLYTL